MRGIEISLFFRCDGGWFSLHTLSRCYFWLLKCFRWQNPRRAPKLQKMCTERDYIRFSLCSHSSAVSNASTIEKPFISVPLRARQLAKFPSNQRMVWTIHFFRLSIDSARFSIHVLLNYNTRYPLTVDCSACVWCPRWSMLRTAAHSKRKINQIKNLIHAKSLHRWLFAFTVTRYTHRATQSSRSDRYR